MVRSNDQCGVGAAYNSIIAGLNRIIIRMNTVIKLLLIYVYSRYSSAW